MFDVTPEYLSDLFIIMYFENGSNDHTKKEAVIFAWFEYICEYKGMCMAHLITLSYN